MKCRKEITGIGKPALPPAVPALVAWAGVAWALWFLTLGATSLPGSPPSLGWAVGLGSLGAATVIGWFALTRRKCPGCGSRQMLDAMEEESLLATERQAAVEQAGGGRQNLPDPQSIRAEIEAELRVGLAKETAELRGRLERDLRDEIGKHMQVDRAAIEQGLRQQITGELRPEIEKALRPQIVKELRPEIEKALRPEVEKALRPEIEKALRPEVEKALRPEIERRLRPEIEQELRATLPKPGVSAEPVPPTAKTGQGTAPRYAIPTAPKPAGTKPASSEASTTPPPVAVKPPMPEASKTPALVSMRASVPEASKARAPIAPSPDSTSEAVGNTRPPVPGKTADPVQKTTTSVGPNPSVATSVAADVPAPGPSKTPVIVSAKPAELANPTSPPQPKPAEAEPAPSQGPVKRAGTPVPGTTSNPHERAERRARVIVSDLSLYHKDLLIKASQAADAKQELGVLWRDSILAYERTVPLEVRSTTNYLEEALEKYLAQLRQAKSSN